MNESQRVRLLRDWNSAANCCSDARSRAVSAKRSAWPRCASLSAFGLNTSISSLAGWNSPGTMLSQLMPRPSLARESTPSCHQPLQRHVELGQAMEPAVQDHPLAGIALAQGEVEVAPFLAQRREEPVAHGALGRRGRRGGAGPAHAVDRERAEAGGVAHLLDEA